ncbi:CIC11C00000000062 [Sungouiella intermedia]|uniref:CIC11C00000000062 n=1 Tax=Sungouiella intermedia TaxID=45354 RepID=A0A1L0BA79_9ASCO|nr:CIC11C00000000062 [[Candida] intermedia]
MKAMKDAEFDKVINLVLLRPVYVNFIREVSNRKDSEFDIDAFKANYKHLLYLKSYSDSGLKKHHEIFIIPMFLIFFQTQETFENICILIELFDKNVFNEEILGDLNKKLKNWKDLSVRQLKRIRIFEFRKFFELLIQLNDKLPLSLSAPSTPIVSQGGFAQLTSAKQSAEFLEGANGNLATSSAESLADLNLSSIYYKSSSLSLVGIFLQLLVLYSNSPKSKKLNFLKMYQACLLTVFKFYHINWNSTGELVRGNQSIRLNHSSDEMMNLESFLDKWKEIFKKM